MQNEVWSFASWVDGGPEGVPASNAEVHAGELWHFDTLCCVNVVLEVHQVAECKLLDLFE